MEILIRTVFSELKTPKNIFAVIFFCQKQKLPISFQISAELFLAFISVGRFVINNSIKMSKKTQLHFQKLKNYKKIGKMGTFDFLNPQFACLYMDVSIDGRRTWPTWGLSCRVNCVYVYCEKTTGPIYLQILT